MGWKRPRLRRERPPGCGKAESVRALFGLAAGKKTAQTGQHIYGGAGMAEKRFVKTYTAMDMMEIWVDREPGGKRPVVFQRQRRRAGTSAGPGWKDHNGF